GCRAPPGPAECTRVGVHDPLCFFLAGLVYPTSLSLGRRRPRCGEPDLAPAAVPPQGRSLLGAGGTGRAPVWGLRRRFPARSETADSRGSHLARLLTHVSEQPGPTGSPLLEAGETGRAALLGLRRRPPPRPETAHGRGRGRGFCRWPVALRAGL